MPYKTCIYCGCRKGNTRDHVIPKRLLREMHLNSFEGNLVNSCSECNFNKSDIVYFPTLRNIHSVYRNMNFKQVYVIAQWVVRYSETLIRMLPDQYSTLNEVLYLNSLGYYDYMLQLIVKYERKLTMAVLDTEYSQKFDELRKNAMETSYYKYGPLKDNYSKHKCMDAIGNLKKRLQAYEETGNTEFLVDVANFAMIEFMYPQVEGAKYTPTDSGAVETVGFGVNEVKREVDDDRF